jgi:ring-1,2-phenylacetyl-CoA epoxidase subunit PaaE
MFNLFKRKDKDKPKETGNHGALHFHTLQVKEVKRETADCVSVLLDVPAELQSSFAYKQGQNLTMRATINGQEVRRSYSLCSSPLDNEWRVAIKLVDGGLFSTYANTQLKAGDTLDVMPPIGRFYTETDAAHKKNYVAFAAGSGITPIISIIKTVLRSEPQSSFTLVYGNKTTHSIIFKEELEGLKNKYMERFRLIHVLSREATDATIHAGRIDAAKCSDLFTKYVELNSDEFFICGPEAMIFCVKDFLEAKGIDKKRVHFELFTSPVEHQPAVVETKKQKGGKNAAKSHITVKQDGRSFEFELGYNDDFILDGALAKGADLPYACKGGVCCTCKAKLLEGKVEMDVHYGLEDDEIAQGFILTCQSRPLTEKVVVDFDVL